MMTHRDDACDALRGQGTIVMHLQALQAQRWPANRQELGTGKEGLLHRFQCEHGSADDLTSDF